MSLNRFLRTFAAGFICLQVWSFCASYSIAQPPPPPPGIPGQGPPEGVEVLARGPIHEAFAEPVEGVPQAGPVIPKAPPPAIEEIPPDQAPQGNMQWIPGYWSWDDERKDYIWISGIWRQPPPDRHWIPGQWIQAANGFQWTAGMWTPLAQKQMDYLPPPPAPLEAAASTPAPTPASMFVPGTWYYQQTRYVWRPGYWLEPHAGWVWIPAHFVWTPAGYVFLEGHWDLDLSRRGMLFAPVYFTTPVYRRPAWFWRPTFVVQTDFLLGALFIRPGFSTYYFGDFFDAAYRRRGFVSFVDFRVGRVGVDPLFSYYRWTNRGNPRWEAEFRAGYAERFTNVAVRPARTLVLGGNVGNVRLNGVVSLNQIRLQGNIHLEAVSAQRVEAERLQARHFQATGVQRVKAEEAVVVKGRAPIRVNDAPHSLKFDMPPVHPAVVAQGKVVVPPVPPGSRPVAHPEPPKRLDRPNLSLSSPPASGLVGPVLDKSLTVPSFRPGTTVVVPGANGKGSVPTLVASQAPKQTPVVASGSSTKKKDDKSVTK